MKVENMLRLMDTGKDFLNRILEVQVLRTINKWNLIKLNASVQEKKPSLK